MSEDSSKTDLIGGIAPGAATLSALLIANSSLGPSYDALVHATAEIRIGSVGLSKSLEHWINDGLMAIFFFLVGLEIKREVILGALASRRDAALPVIGALGGFLIPAAIYGALNWGDAHALGGFAIPTATDIAFVIGICALLGSIVPPALKIFLLALAIIDDLLAIIVIALFYTDDLSILSLSLGGLGVAALIALNVANVRILSPYVIVGLFTWVCVLKSGVHATLAGVALGFAVPLSSHEGKSLLLQTEHALKPWVSYAIVPIFAFANAGVPLTGMSPASLLSPIPLGIILGLFVGKQLGVFAAMFGAIKAQVAARPTGASMIQVYGASALTGVGFTMSLFIGTLAFEEESLMMQIRLAILIASALSGILAMALLLIASRRKSPMAIKKSAAFGDSSRSAAL